MNKTIRTSFDALGKTKPIVGTVVMPTYQIKVNGQWAISIYCPDCENFTPHGKLLNDDVICGLCGCEHAS